MHNSLGPLEQEMFDLSLCLAFRYKFEEVDSQSEMSHPSYIMKLLFEMTEASCLESTFTKLIYLPQSLLLELGLNGKESQRVKCFLHQMPFVVNIKFSNQATLHHSCPCSIIL